jgi:hypothetical protein
MTEEAFLRYRLDVLNQIPDSLYKRSSIEAIENRIASLRRSHRHARDRSNGPATERAG